ncbi:carbohydrate-binding module family 1 protein [Sodiomyces alcalophilus JCM 7366]|uniref:carbohydrate-binding module family 1 protein n=1 Tax=Sodiomyces alcalophilus JCM 7366 TaxID=591952 RepID=UPI0039B4C2D2
MYVKAILAVLLGSQAVNGQLAKLAREAGLEYFGTCIGEGNTNDQTYMNILRNLDEFDQVVPENGQKWDSLQPQQGNFNWGQGDIVANIARQNNQLLRCHTLTWHSQLPGWVRDGNWNRQTLTAVIETHIATVLRHYQGQCYHWDVVNEAADDNGNWRNSVFYRVLGTDFLPISFFAARQADPSTKLYYNDYNLEYNNAKTDITVEMVKIIQRAGAPIDGVGFQGHLIVGSTPSRQALANTLRRFTALGVEVAYTEVDIRHASLPPNQQALVTQGNDYANVVGSCLDVDGCIGFTVWGFTDKYSWIPHTFPGEGDAMLYDSNFGKKPAWTSVSSVLAAAATGGPSPPPTSPPPTNPPPTNPPPTNPPPSGGNCSGMWGQCGGQGWNGPTCCSQGTCQQQNPWYSQCL